jgi:CheY-like chemotaxis protein
MLTVILGLAERGLRQRDAAPSSIRDLQQIHAAAARSAELVSQLLAFSRRQTVSPQPVDIGERVLGVERLLRRIIEEDIDLRFEIARDLWRASIDPSQLDQIVANLAINSRDAMPQGGTLTVEAANTLIDAGYCQRNTDATPGEYVMLAVTDTGKGMDRETLEHAFEPFFTTKDQGRGTGLGLATVYGVVRQNGGFVNLYSEIGHGTVARIYLPRHVAEDASRAVPIERPAQGGTETILLVEDEEQLRLLVQTMLEPLGYTVLAAANPDQAIETCTRAGHVHLLLTDVVLPGMNGRELQDRVMMLQPGIRVLFMSGYTANVIAHRGVLDKGVHFLQKPFAAESLARKVRAVLDGADPA